MDDHIPRYGASNFYGPGDQEQLRSPRSHGRTQGYSSAREYAAAGEYGDDWRRDAPRGRDAYGQRGDYEGERYRYDLPGDGYRADQGGSRSSGGGRSDQNRGQDRGFFERAGDEVRSWFGDDEAEHRRERDARNDERQYRDDPHYGQWRRERIAEIDRDYNEYRRENADRFHREFTGWRTERQGQRDGLGRVSEHMEVLGSDGEHLGTVDKVRGDRIILTKNDPNAGGHHHSIPSRWIQSVDDKVTLRKTTEEARKAWKDEDRSALFGDDDLQVNRALSGIY